MYFQSRWVAASAEESFTKTKSSSFQRSFYFQFMESETEKAASEQEHQIKSAEYSAIMSKLHFYEKDMPRSISRARYFVKKNKNTHTQKKQKTKKKCVQN